MTKSVEEMPKTLNVETFKVDNDPILYVHAEKGGLCKGPFKYYVCMFLAFLGPTTHLHQHKCTVNQHFLTPPTHLFADVIHEWSQGKFLTLEIHISHNIFLFSDQKLYLPRPHD